MDNQIKSLNDIPSYLLYGNKMYVPIIIKTDGDGEPLFKGMYAMAYKNGIIDPNKYLFKVGGDTYEEVATKLIDAFGKLPVRNRIENGHVWMNKKGAPKQLGFDMG